MLAESEVAIGISCEGLGGCAAPCECVSCNVACGTGCVAGCVAACTANPAVASSASSQTMSVASTGESALVVSGNEAMNNSGVDKYVEHIAAVLMYPWYKWF